ncbi:MAG: hypothetical protein LLF83_02400 [Methanobacterium sp.]|nr:hypothetical protein [Methanobacterium sp.]
MHQFEWLAGSGYEIESVNAQSQNNIVVLKIVGNGKIPPLKNFQKKVKGKIYGKTMKIEVVYSDTFSVKS